MDKNFFENLEKVAKTKILSIPELKKSFDNDKTYLLHENDTKNAQIYMALINYLSTQKYKVKRKIKFTRARTFVGLQ